MTTLFFGYRWGKLTLAATDGSKPEKDDWQTINEASLSEELQDLLEEYREAYQLAAAAKKAFETQFKASAGYTAKQEKPKAPSKAVNLADLLEQWKANGRAV